MSAPGVLEAFRFCPRCGSQFTAHSERLVCGHCELNYYLNPKPCASIALRNPNGEYLFVQRAVEPAKGAWDLPGGFVDQHESFEEAACREIAEELGLQLLPDKLRYLTSSYDSYVFDGIRWDTLGIVFVADITKNLRLQPQDDVASCTFFAPQNFPKDNLAFPWMEQTLPLLTRQETNK